jgi:hypothetical protein
LDASTNILDIDANHGYGPQPIPVERDSQIAELLESYVSAPEGERDDFRGRLGERHVSVLWAFAERMASLAVREGSAQPLRQSLLALALAGDRHDVREGIMILPLVYRSAELLGVEPAPLFAEAARMSDGVEMTEAIETFPARGPADRRLSAFDFVESTDADGFRYAATW